MFSESELSVLGSMTSNSISPEERAGLLAEHAYSVTVGKKDSQYMNARPIQSLVDWGLEPCSDGEFLARLSTIAKLSRAREERTRERVELARAKEPTSTAQPALPSRS